MEAALDIEPIDNILSENPISEQKSDLEKVCIISLEEQINNSIEQIESKSIEIEEMFINKGDNTFTDEECEYLSELTQVFSNKSLTTCEVIDIIEKRIQEMAGGPKNYPLDFYGPKALETFKPFLENIYPELFEAPPDAVQTTEIAEYLKKSDILKFENWKELTSQERIDILNDLERTVAKIAHRLPLEVCHADIEGCHGQYLNGKITINTELLESSGLNIDNFHKCLETFFHEGRHGYQDYNIRGVWEQANGRVVHPRMSELVDWVKNEGNFYFNGFNVKDLGLGYKDGSQPFNVKVGPFEFFGDQLRRIGYDLYRSQAMEADANNFAMDIIYKSKQST